MARLRILLIICLQGICILLSCRCTNVDYPVNKNILTSSEQSTCFSISISEAEDGLYRFLDEMSPNTKSAPNRIISNKFTLKFDSNGADKDAVVLHVFNFDENRGFAIMAGDNRVPSPMCFIEEGNCDIDAPITDLETLFLQK